eukprot:638441_1
MMNYSSSDSDSDDAPLWAGPAKHLQNGTPHSLRNGYSYTSPKSPSPRRKSSSPRRGGSSSPRRTLSPCRGMKLSPRRTSSPPRRTSSPPRRTSSPPRHQMSSSSLRTSSSPARRQVKTEVRASKYAIASSDSDSDQALVPRKPKTNGFSLSKPAGPQRSKMVIKREPKFVKTEPVRRKTPMDRFVVDRSEDSSSDSFDDSDSDTPLFVKPSSSSVKRRKPASSTSSRPAKKQRSGDDPDKVYPASRYEVMDECVPLEADKDAHNWWEEDVLEKNRNSTLKWHKLRHNGVIFPPAYTPHGVKLLYQGKPVELTPRQEEAATWFAVLIESDHAKNPVFRKNFFKDWQKLLGRGHVIRNLDDIDFRPIYEWYQVEKERKKEEKKKPKIKKQLKEAKALEQSIYQFAIVDGVKQKVGNYCVELPGLFRGRGKHPKTGMIKRRVMPEDVELNIGKDCQIPKCPVEGHQWGGIMHNLEVTYIARFRDHIQGTMKPVYLHASSRFKGENDLKKYEVARRLKTEIENIRSNYTKKFNSSDMKTRQLGTAVWIIDRLAIRVGNEKDIEESADTVGVCTLRREHIVLGDEPKPKKEKEEEDEASEAGQVADKENFITLDFLGKDSMRYFNTVEVDPTVYKNLKMFLRNKRPEKMIFDRLDSGDVNEYLSRMMEGLSAKVFRTYNASFTLQNELYNKNGEVWVTTEDTVDRKKYFYDEANRHVAILCNHQKSVSKGHETAMQKIEDRLKNAKKKKKEIHKDLKGLKRKSSPKASNRPKKKVRSKEQLLSTLARVDQQIEKIEFQMKTKSSTKEVALGTSKINYMDPRVTVAWCKNLEVPIEKVFPRALLDKFPWAMSVDPKYQF